MRIVRTFEDLSTVVHDACVAIGVFDGVHLGHQRVIAEACADARAAGGASVVLTFDPHPMRVLHTEKAPPLLTSTPHKLRLLERLNVDICLLLTFDIPFSEQPPEQFIESLAKHTNHLREICVGTRFRFGHNRTGDVRLIKKLALVHGYLAKEIASVKLGEETISSTAVRQHVLHGRLDRATAMLGRPFSILGAVEPGDARGRQLGYPTANLNPSNEVLPPNGVYAVRALVGQESFDGVVNIGIRPTFESHDHRSFVELHVFDLARDLYGHDVEVSFIDKLRDERKFDSADALKRQIAADIAEARRILAKQ
ncbi:MAG: bifunctional riboflavin kinase/FAD synthetase [Verrucomicrobiia bacterium]